MKKVLFLVLYCFISIAGFVQFDIDEELHKILDRQGLEPLQKLVQPAVNVELGRMLFFDRILSDHKEVSCVICHLPHLHSGDSLFLPIGVSGKGLGKWKEMGKGERELRNIPEIFNRGAEAGIPCFGKAGYMVQIRKGLSSR